MLLILFAVVAAVGVDLGAPAIDRDGAANDLDADVAVGWY